MRQHFRNILFCLMFVTSISQAIEVDSYTYSYIPLSDSRDAINSVLNRYIRDTLIDTKPHLDKILNRGRSISPGMIESYFMYNWKTVAGEKNQTAYNLVLSSPEICIGLNNCKDWPKLERIFLKQGESIYERAQYSSTSREFVASVVNLCGVRVGSDKITHFIMDARAYYHKLMAGMSNEELAKQMDYIERGSCGLDNTHVYSKSDIYVNNKGVEFYNKIFQGENPYVAYNQTTRQLEQINKVDICDYVDDNWDERVLKNSYGDYDTTKLFEVIEREKSHPMRIDRDELLSRQFELASVFKSLTLLPGVTTYRSLRSQKMILEFDIFAAKPKPFHIKVITSPEK